MTVNSPRSMPTWKELAAFHKEVPRHSLDSGRRGLDVSARHQAAIVGRCSEPWQRPRRQSVAPSLSLRRPRSAYTIFLHDYHPIIAEHHPQLDAASIMAEVGQEWRQLSHADKAHYRALAEEEERLFQQAAVAVAPKSPPQLPSRSPSPTKPAKKNKTRQASPTRHASIKPLVDANGHYRRPKGRPPVGYRWDPMEGLWRLTDTNDTKTPPPSSHPWDQTEPVARAHATTNKSRPSTTTATATTTIKARSLAKQTSTTTLHKRPMGRAPHECRWDAAQGAWLPTVPLVRREEDGLFEQPHKKAPKGFVWDARVGLWASEHQKVETSGPRTGPRSTTSGRVKMSSQPPSALELYAVLPQKRRSIESSAGGPPAKKPKGPSVAAADDELQVDPEPVEKKKRGRPKGSKNKPKNVATLAVTTQAKDPPTRASAPEPRTLDTPGRAKYATRLAAAGEDAMTDHETAALVEKKQRGRVKGSKNQPKADATQAGTDPPSLAIEFAPPLPKRRGQSTVAKASPAKKGSVSYNKVTKDSKNKNTRSGTATQPPAPKRSGKPPIGTNSPNSIATTSIVLRKRQDGRVLRSEPSPNTLAAAAVLDRMIHQPATGLGTTTGPPKFQSKYVECGKCNGCRTAADCGTCLPCLQLTDLPPDYASLPFYPVCVLRICTQPVLRGPAKDDMSEVESLSDHSSFVDGRMSDMSEDGNSDAEDAVAELDNKSTKSGATISGASLVRQLNMTIRMEMDDTSADSDQD